MTSSCGKLLVVSVYATSPPAHLHACAASRAGQTFLGKSLREAVSYRAQTLQCCVTFLQKGHPTHPSGHFQYFFSAFPLNCSLTFLLQAPGIPQHCQGLAGAHVLSPSQCKSFGTFVVSIVQDFKRTSGTTGSLGLWHYLILVSSALVLWCAQVCSFLTYILL